MSLWTLLSGCTPAPGPSDAASEPTGSDSAAAPVDSGVPTPPATTPPSPTGDTAAPPVPLEGTVWAIYDGASTGDALAVGAAASVTFEVGMVVADRGVATESWTLTAVVEPPGAASLTAFPPIVALEPTTDAILVDAVLTPLDAGPFRVSLYAASTTDPLGSTTVGPAFEAGAAPPLRDVITYAGPRTGVLGPAEVPEDQLERPQGRNALFQVRNRTSTACTVRIEATLARADGSTTGLSTGVDPGVTVEAGADTVSFLTLYAEDAVVGETLILTAWPEDPCGGSAEPTVTELVVGATAP